MGEVWIVMETDPDFMSTPWRHFYPSLDSAVEAIREHSAEYALYGGGDDESPIDPPPLVVAPDGDLWLVGASDRDSWYSWTAVKVVAAG